MSHFATIQTEVRDIEALESACRELDLELIQDAEARGYGSKTRRGDYVIRLAQSPYDIAIRQTDDGSCELTTDWWGGHVAKAVGPNYGRLLQLYGVHKATREAQRRGLRVRRHSQKDGSIKVLIGGL